MKPVECARGEELSRALHRGEIAADLRDHARLCAECSELAKISVWMNRLASETPRRVLPDPTILRLKAQLFGTTSADEKVMQPLHFLQRFAFGVIALCWVSLLTWKWESFSNFSVEGVLTGAIEGLSFSPSLMAILFTLGCATIVVTVQTALAE
ncbi:MAG TPA: hypothetical protein VM557_09170 [Thermoanaerobaculia bacterium]|nr:hypothetical protein [Thermoanaerobaculia bacterium]